MGRLGHNAFTSITLQTVLKENYMTHAIFVNNLYEGGLNRLHLTCKLSDSTYFRRIMWSMQFFVDRWTDLPYEWVCDANGVEWQTGLYKFCIYCSSTNSHYPGILLINFWPWLLTVTCCQIDIAELDDFAQAAFRGYKSLNRIQSRIYHTVYYTNENILVRCFVHWFCELQFANHCSESMCLNLFSINLQVCAPTGAGKTNIAMISILHEVQRLPFLCFCDYSVSL